MDYQSTSRKVRKSILKMAFQAQEGHVGSALSCVDILTVLYFEILNIDPKNPLSKNRDRLIFSKGHAAAALYAVLAKRGFFKESLLEKYCQDGSSIAGHSTRGSLPGIEATTGSLGHGFPMASGMAMALTRDDNKARVFVVISDGECDEGSTWESALFASHYKLDNLVVIVDYNKWQSYGKVKDVLDLEPFAEKWESFGFSVKEVNGHNFNQLEKVFSKLPFEKNKPSLVICHTTKGKGVSFLENTLESHYHHLTKEEYNKALKEI